MRHEDVRRFYAEHGKELERYLTRRLSCAQTAADLKHETFTRLINGKTFDRIDNPRAYLFQIARNLVADHFRSKSLPTQPASPETWERVPDEAPGPERTVIARESLHRLEKALERLPPRQREILVMHKYQELSYTEIASKLGISKNTVMVHMMRALAHCRDFLSRE